MNQPNRCPLPEGESRNQTKRKLLQQIKAIEQHNAILQADLNLSRKRGRTKIVTVQKAQEDWLSLSSLQNSKLNESWHDDPMLMRMLPLISGITILKAEPARDKPQQQQRHDASNTKIRTFDFHAKVCAKHALAKEFWVKMVVEFQPNNDSGARIAEVELAADDNNEEWNDMCQVAKETCNLPLVFRQIVEFCKFSWRRTRMLAEYKESIQQPHPHIIRVDWNDSSFIEFSYKWTVSWASSGKGVLEISNCKVNSASRGKSAAILHSGGLAQLLKCTKGEGHEALGIMLQAVLVKQSVEESGE